MGSLAKIASMGSTPVQSPFIWGRLKEGKGDGEVAPLNPEHLLGRLDDSSDGNSSMTCGA